MMMLSPRQREIEEREKAILEVARELLLESGYYALTMDRIALASACPKGTMYQSFASKEDIVLALACQSGERRDNMIARATKFQGRPRERILAMGEAAALFSRLNPDDSRILHTATGPIREKAVPERTRALARLEARAVDLLLGVLGEARAQGDLPLRDGSTMEEMAFGIWALVEGGFTLIESGVPHNAFGIGTPWTHVFRVFNVLADGYGWRPLFAEFDWEESLARVRRTLFPEEAQRLYGEGAWYGDGA
ncbi:MAG: TetR/AcrR family transcriptional regulator [Candidatus Hydrogenedentes bacterium]|nr:TetR/AcrR family transcriptional regulator [Candidatus Hydrogenedentota bacterium]